MKISSVQHIPIVRAFISYKEIYFHCPSPFTQYAISFCVNRIDPWIISEVKIKVKIITIILSRKQRKFSNSENRKWILLAIFFFLSIFAFLMENVWIRGKCRIDFARITNIKIRSARISSPIHWSQRTSETHREQNKGDRELKHFSPLIFYWEKEAESKKNRRKSV